MNQFTNQKLTGAEEKKEGTEQCEKSRYTIKSRKKDAKKGDRFPD